MPTGKVKWFDPKKGYGFIVGDEGQDVFVHYTSIQGEGFRALKDGEAVTYELVESDKGYQARNVQQASALASGASAAEDGGSAAEDGAAAAEDGAAAVEDGAAAVEDGGSAAEDGGSAAEDGGPAEAQAQAT